MAWTDERVDMLKQYWGQGKSASQIAALLGDVTRNAVIGKAHRLGLSGRPSPIRNRPATPRPKAAKQKRSRAEAPRLATARAAPLIAPAEPPPPPLNGTGVSLAELTEKMCRWPNGDPREPGFHFCGHEVHPGSSYCPYHTAEAYQKPARKEDRKPAVAQPVTVALAQMRMVG